MSAKPHRQQQQPHTSARRLTELPRGMRPSRSDSFGGKHSFIPRPSLRAASFDRMSGIRPLDGGGGCEQSSRSRNKSAEPMHNYYTPLRTDARSYATPTFSARSVDAYGSERRRSPSAERAGSLRYTLQRALKVEPVAETRTVSDPMWQRATGNRVLAMIREDPIVSKELSSGPASLKPISINVFVNLTNYYFGKFGGARFQINRNDYVDKLPSIARRLLYPGVLTKSWLKSVNAMHTYPHLLAFMSYLIDIASIKNYTETSINLARLCGTNDAGILRQMRHEYFSQAWIKFQDTDDLDDLMENYITALKNAYQITDEDDAKSGKDLLELKRQKQDLIMITEKLKEDHDLASNQVQALKNKSTQLENECVEYNNKIAEAKERIVQSRKMKHNVKVNIEELQNQVDLLRVQLSKQKMSTDKYEELIKSTERINEVVHCKEEFLIQMKKMSFEKDLKLVTERKKVLDVSTLVKKKLFAVELAAGRPLTDFTMSERDFLVQGTIENIKQNNSHLKVLTTEVESQFQTLQIEKNSISTKMYELKRKIDGCKSQLHSSEDTLAKLEHDIECEERLIEEGRRHKEDMERRRAQICDLDEIMQIKLKDANEELASWKNEELEWQNKLEETKQLEKVVHEACEKRCLALIGEYLSQAHGVLDSLQEQPVAQ